MSIPRYRDHRSHFRTLRASILKAADPGLLVRRHFGVEGDWLRAGSHRLPLHHSRLILIGAGKASGRMAQTVVQILGEHPVTGVVVMPEGVAWEPVPGLRKFEGGHPLPDAGSLAAGEAVDTVLRSSHPDDIVLALISGGASALLELPLPGIDLEDLQALNTLLLRSGADIHQINLVRKSLSRIKAGGLARLAAPARVASLILSDVVGDRLSSIASGPTVLRRADPAASRKILERLGLWRQVPQSVRHALRRQAGSGARRARRPVNVLIGTNRTILSAGVGTAEELGFRAQILSTQMRGEARRVGASFSHRLGRVRHRPAALVMGGETTVTIQGDGRGGRNQELALSAALTMIADARVALMALASDGVDGPTDAAGAIVSAATMEAMRTAGLDPRAALANNDSYPLLDRIGALIRTGPTGTNLNDLVIGLAYL